MDMSSGITSSSGIANSRDFSSSHDTSSHVPSHDTTHHADAGGGLASSASVPRPGEFTEQATGQLHSSGQLEPRREAETPSQPSGPATYGVPTGQGMASSPGVPAPGATIDPATGMPHSEGMTRADLEATRAAEHRDSDKQPHDWDMQPQPGMYGAATGGGLATSANVPPPGTTINPATGLPNTAGMTRAELAAKREAEKARQDALHSSPQQNAAAARRTSFSEDMDKTFNDISQAHVQPPPSAALGAASAAAASTQSPRAAAPGSAAQPTQHQDPSTATFTERATSATHEASSGAMDSSDTTADVTALTLDGGTTVYFIDDGTEFPGDTTPAILHAETDLMDSRQTGDTTPTAPRSGREEFDHSEIASPQQAAEHNLNYGNLKADPAAGVAESTAPTHNSGPLSHGSQSAPHERAGMETGQTTTHHPHDSNLSHGIPGEDPSIAYGVPVEPTDSTPGITVQPAEPSQHSHTGGAVAAGALGTGAALATASTTRRGAERAESSASVTAIHGGSEGWPNNRAHHDEDGTPGTPPATDTPASGANSASHSTGHGYLETQRGFNPAESTASITAIRSGHEGNSPSASPQPGRSFSSPLAVIPPKTAEPDESVEIAPPPHHANASADPRADSAAASFTTAPSTIRHDSHDATTDSHSPDRPPRSDLRSVPPATSTPDEESPVKVSNKDDGLPPAATTAGAAAVVASQLKAEEAQAKAAPSNGTAADKGGFQKGHQRNVSSSSSATRKKHGLLSKLKEVMSSKS